MTNIVPGFLRVSEEYQIPRGKKIPVPLPHDGPFLESDPPMQNASYPTRLAGGDSEPDYSMGLPEPEPDLFLHYQTHYKI